MASYESLVGNACGSPTAVPASYLGDPAYAALCSIPRALLGIDVGIWYDQFKTSAKSKGPLLRYSCS